MAVKRLSRTRRFGRWSKRTAKGALAGAAVGGVLGLVAEKLTHMDTAGTQPGGSQFLWQIPAAGAAAGAGLTGVSTGIAGLF